AQVAESRPEVVVPPNLIPEDAPAITPEMVTLVSLDQAAIDRIVAAVPGGAANVQDIYPLAPLQEGILFHHLLGGAGDTYLLPTLLGFESREGLERFVETLQTLVDRHDILRTAVMWEALAEPVQVVHRRAALPFETVALDPSAGDPAEQLKARFDPRHHRMDVGRPPLLRAVAARETTGDRWLLLILAHHMVLDHTTMELLVEEVDLIEAGRAAELPPAIPFRTFVARARLGVGRDAHDEFFDRLLGDIDEPTAPFGLLDVQGDGTAVTEARTMLDPQLARQLREQARALGVSAATLVHLAWALVVGRCASRSAVVFGTVMFGRLQGGTGVDRVPGMFINTLPVRIDVGSQGVAAAARQTQALLTDLIRHEHAPLSLAQRASRVAAPTPLFSALLNYRHSATPDTAKAPPVPPDEPPAPADGPAAGTGRVLLWNEERTNYPVTLSVDDLGEDFLFTAIVSAPVSAQRLCELIETALARLSEALAVAPERPLSEIDVLASAERQRIVSEWNDTAADYPADACIHQLFEAQAARTPDAVALESEGAQVTYAELDARAEHVARRLRGLGVGPDARVAVCAQRSVEMIVALLAAMKAGGAYVPLDPTYPTRRLAEMLADSGPVAALTHGPARAALEAALAELPAGVPVIDLDQQSPDGVELHQRRNEPQTRATARDLAYVIYTSGSTGTPKGAMNEHRAVVNRLVWLQRHWQLGGGDVFLQKTPFTFDVSVGEIFCPLISGSRLVIARPDGHKDPAYLAEVIEARGVNVVHFVPSMLQLFLEHEGVEKRCRGLRRVMCSGEALPAAVVRRFHERLSGVELLNLYGPTEAAVEVLTWPCAPEDAAGPIPIGRPIANARVYVLDQALRPAPVGVAGELYIGGVPVGRGYLQRPELTAERFVADPFASEAGARLYKTGDVARWRADGAVEYLGRNDFQVKVRGFRIELGEIEARLAGLPGVSQAAVAMTGGSGDQQLVGYYTAAPGADPEWLRVEILRAGLGEHLPDYMVPRRFVRLELLPLTSSGKVDRRALPAPDSGAARVHEEPVGDVEVTLARVWSELLGVARVSRTDNFFELGGHSLTAVRMIEGMRRAGYRATVADLFALPSLAELAGVTERIVDGDGAAEQEIEEIII
ncbi:MAG TPA: amino acid adenylation domain-containing protein, partial [Polyangia bacterium]|nr:amino acid adenylation domain-containing protein [Polyangia bacterium]